MLAKRLLIVFFTIIVIVALYNLPKVFVGNDEELKAGSDGESRDEVVEEAFIEQHTEEIAPEIEKKLNRFQHDFNNAVNDQLKLVLADSLSILYTSIYRYDSAAEFRAVKAEIDPTVDHIEAAGEAYYEALGFAMDKNKAALLGVRARKYFNRILEVNPDRYDIKTKVGMTYISTDDPMRGINTLKEVIEQDPENELALFNLGVLSVQSGQYEKAIEWFKALTKVNPQNLQGQFYLGVSYFEKGEKDNAIKQFELVKSMESDPSVRATAESYLDVLL
ncbi:tetratricopeptide repeat protein [Bacteroidota bacterium]